jgi:hypothetical protein
LDCPAALSWWPSFRKAQSFWLCMDHAFKLVNTTQVNYRRTNSSSWLRKAEISSFIRVLNAFLALIHEGLMLGLCQTGVREHPLCSTTTMTRKVPNAPIKSVMLRRSLEPLLWFVIRVRDHQEVPWQRSGKP